MKDLNSFATLCCGVGLAALMSGCSHGATSVAAIPASGEGTATLQVGQRSGVTIRGAIDGGVFHVCAPASGSEVSCGLAVRLDVPSPDRNASPDTIPGYHPADLVSAYKLPSATRGSGQTIAIVVPLDDPVAGANLDHYRAVFGLPACTKSNGCFKKVNQRGFARNYPPPDPNWASEAAADLDMASAICPNCHLLLVEADLPDTPDIAAAVDTAARLGADVISNSYFAQDTSENPHYRHPGKIVVAMSGDDGFLQPAYFPASSQYVVAVGGTTLITASNARGWSETVWSDSGSGCSNLPKPSWQHDARCSHRMVADVAAVADPTTGVAMYDTYGRPGWLVVGGTDVSAPIIAGVYALAANESRLVYARGLYRFPNHLFDVTSGKNGVCGFTYLCNGKIGYDGPTGNGTPNGIGAF